MYRPWILSILSFLLSVVLAACNTPQQPQTQVPIPNQVINNQTQQLPKTPVKRIVSLSSLAADIIAQLDQTKLVGVLDSSLFKNDPKFKNITRVSRGQGNPNLETIVSLKPDLVIGAAGFSTVPLQKIQQLGIPVFYTQVNNWKALIELTKTLSQAIDVNPQPLLNRYQTFLPNQLVNNSTTLLLVSRQPITTPNKDSWAGDLLTQFGAKNIAAELSGNSPIRGYATLSPEKVLEAKPEVLLVASFEPNLLDNLKKEAFWQKLPATKNNRVHVFDYYGLINPGSIDAIEKACEKLKQVFLIN
ncbi:MAG TPA: ABC transporter substrate-binding protein [Nostocaceae cyanobacterium]|nr:ABC transporter substrate-binding protein [Nostocaceae cyanobacterium]